MVLNLVLSLREIKCLLMDVTCFISTVHKRTMVTKKEMIGDYRGTFDPKKALYILKVMLDPTKTF